MTSADHHSLETSVQTVDNELLEAWRPWITQAAKRFGATGYGATAAALTPADISEYIQSPQLMYAFASGDEGEPRSLIVVVRAVWETEILERTVAKIAWFAADDLAGGQRLASMVIARARADDVVLLSASPGHSPSYIHTALTTSGFHVASQALTLRADLEQIAPRVAKIPLRGSFRAATPDDADAIAALASVGFEDQRFTSDPYFPKEWGQRLLAAWARNLVLHAADSVVVAESGSQIIGFISMTLDTKRRAAVPPLLAIDQRYNGWGIGPMLVRVMLDWYRERGVDVFIGGTEKSNVPINALYVRLGIGFIDSNIVYHASPALRDIATAAD